jgi:hypothetical protein
LTPEISEIPEFPEISETADQNLADVLVNNAGVRYSVHGTPVSSASGMP